MNKTDTMIQDGEVHISLGEMRLKASIENVSGDRMQLRIHDPHFPPSSGSSHKPAIRAIHTLVATLQSIKSKLDLREKESSPPSVEEMRELAATIGGAITKDTLGLERELAKLPAVERETLRPLCHAALLPLLSGSPFHHRVFTKPLGYPGDHEMVRMILSDNPFEGSSLYFKIVNAVLLASPPAQAHRNRIVFLTQALARHSKAGPITVLNLGCGPAKEIEKLMRLGLADNIDISLLDFNEETLERTKESLERTKQETRSSITLRFIQQSVAQVIKRGNRLGEACGTHNCFDLVYCAGLFDYLNDKTCRKLLSIFEGLATENGMVLSTNVDSSNPVKLFMDYCMDWQLIYRNSDEMMSLCPDLESSSIRKDSTGVNIFLETDKDKANVLLV